MEDFRLKMMIEQFFDAVLTAEEERELCRYLRENDVPAELRKDKEMILAFCRESEEIELPDGAALRLEAMIDGLAEKSTPTTNDEKITTKTYRRIAGIPRRIWWYGAAAIVLLTVGIQFINENNTTSATKERNTTTAQFFDTEKDTFDNPEDAMLCLQAALNDISLAVNSTQNNIKEIEATLGASIKMSTNKDNI